MSAKPSYELCPDCGEKFPRNEYRDHTRKHCKVWREQNTRRKELIKRVVGKPSKPKDNPHEDFDRAKHVLD